ncbi:MAG: hypothetical protein IIY22_06990, partial [Erysipelotrichaceae bacterium]|nr:hypothetical protein [Erysipelotrichaceae bacterium]
MKNDKIRKLEIAVVLLFVFFALLIMIGRRFLNKEEEPPQEIIEENEPVIDYSKIEVISGKYYYEDDNFSSSFGIDVSEFQDDIDWKKVKEDGVEFVYL